MALSSLNVEVRETCEDFSIGNAMEMGLGDTGLSSLCAFAEASFQGLLLWELRGINTN